MAEENSQISDGSEDKFQRAGQVLADARKSKGLSLEDVSARLKITVPYLKALEDCEYDQLPGTAFVRGYLRSYAKLVEVDDKHILSLYGETVQADEQVARMLREKPLDNHGVPGGKWLAIVSLVLLVAFVGGSVYWWNNQAAPAGTAPVRTVNVSPATEPEEQESPVATTAQAAAEEAVAEEGAPATEVAAAEAQLAEQEPAPVATVDAAVETAVKSAEEAAPVAEPVQPVAEVAPNSETPKPAVEVSAQDLLVVRFSDECWLEVRDAEDQVLFSGLKPANSELTLTGNGPLKIKFGNAASVSEVIFNGETVTKEIPASSRGVGRLTLG